MREILIELFERITLYRGQGKLAVLFVTAMIGLFFMRKYHRGRVNPLLFVVSVFTGISVAFADILEEIFAKNRDRKGLKIFYSVISTLFIVFAITLSGDRIWLSDFSDKRENIRGQLDDAEETASYLKDISDSPRVLADPELMTRLLCYSPDIESLYSVEQGLEQKELPEEEKKLFDAICDQHPPMEQITRIAGKYGHFYVVVDKTQKWPERAAEGKYERLNTIGNIDIYEYGGIADE